MSHNWQMCIVYSICDFWLNVLKVLYDCPNISLHKVQNSILYLLQLRVVLTWQIICTSMLKVISDFRIKSFRDVH